MFLYQTFGVRSCSVVIYSMCVILFIWLKSLSKMLKKNIYIYQQIMMNIYDHVILCLIGTFSVDVLGQLPTDVFFTYSSFLRQSDQRHSSQCASGTDNCYGKL